MSAESRTPSVPNGGSGPATFVPRRPVLLDLFCGAGGAAAGYWRAGFEVLGVDVKPQPNYPFRLIQTDGLEWMSRWVEHPGAVDVAAIHASPPCQAFTAYQRTGNVGEQHPDLVARTRELLRAIGLPYVIENVEGAPLIDPVVICGTMFDPPMEVQRHRLFETNWPLEPPQWPCRHKLNSSRFPASTNRRKGSRRTIAIGQWNVPLDVQREAMGIDWMTLEELSEAIPPAYTHYIGLELQTHLAGGPWEPPAPDPRLIVRKGNDGQVLA